MNIGRVDGSGGQGGAEASHLRAGGAGDREAVGSVNLPVVGWPRNFKTPKSNNNSYVVFLC